MREYKFKRGYKATTERLEEMLKKHFGEFKKDGNKYIVSFGAMEEMVAWIENKKLYVETKTNKNVPDDVALETIKKYNKFLEDLTGYTAKERRKHMMKEVEEG